MMRLSEETTNVLTLGDGCCLGLRLLDDSIREQVSSMTRLKVCEILSVS